jgi:hypothetical protein
MTTVAVARAPREAISAPDLSWKELYRAGGICALLAGMLYIVALALDFIMPPPPTAGGAAS